MPIDLQMPAGTVEAGPDYEAGDDDDKGDKPEKVPTFKTRAYNGGMMRPRVRMYDTGGIPTVIDCATLKVDRGGNKLPVLYSHDRADPIGHTNSVTVGTSTIDAEGPLSVPCASRDKVAGGAKNGYRWAVSVGVETPELEYISSSDTATVNGRTVRGPLYIARRGVLREISLLPIGADSSASATVTATLATEQHMDPDLQAFIEAAGFNADEVAKNAKQLAHFTAQHAATLEAAAEDDQSQTAGQSTATVEGAADDFVTELRKKAADEARRTARIIEICAEHKNPTIKVQGKDQPLQVVAIEAGWNLERVELEALRASRPAAPAIHSTGRAQTHTIEAVTAGLMQRVGVDIESNHFRGSAAIEAGTPDWLSADVNAERFQRTADAGRQFRHAHIMEILATAAEIETGVRPHGNRAILEAAFSTNSISTLFGATAGARALMGFREVPDTTAGWTTTGTVPDFEEHGRHGIDQISSLDYLPSGGEAGHAKRSAYKEVQSAARYAKQFMIDEQDLIGDRLNLLRDTPFKMGQAAGRMRPDLVYGLLLANPTMARTGRAAFHTDDGTLLQAAAFSSAALSLAISSLMKQKDGDATLGLRPTHLITGTELSDLVVQTIGSVWLSNDSGKGANNPIARYGITPVADARISNGVVHPKTKVLQTGSATAWYLLSTDGETIEVVTVEGTGGVPVIVTTNLRGVGKFGVQTEVKYDIGANIMENRTMRRNAGA